MPRAFIDLQLATLVDTVPDGPGWLHEVKFDGYRVECVLDRGRARLFTRNGNDWTARFPGVAEAAAKLRAGQAILDGEVVALLPDGRSSFQLLQERLGASPPGEMVYYVFDLLQVDGKNLRRTPLKERKRRLRTLLGTGA
ncbi:MAG TPA: hypothetical protein VFU23_09195, partial [Gemmatimonadales bacterium]|nr:hypothetical protein [Gemmatimonadales bacterium]